MELSRLQQQFLKDLFKNKESKKSVIIAQYYKFCNEIELYEFSIECLIKLPLSKLLELLTPTKEGLISYYFPIY